MLKNRFWASLIAFLSDFEHGVEKWILGFFSIFLFFQSVFEVKR